VGRLRPDIQVRMLAQERNSGDGSTVDLERFQIVNFDDFRKPQLFKHEP
jgi:hypothetical protein